MPSVVNLDALIACFVALFAIAIGISAITRRRSWASGAFFSGMIILALVCVFSAFGMQASDIDELKGWLTAAFVAKCALPIAWIAFSLCYSRGNYREFISRWRWILVFSVVLPAGILINSGGHLFLSPAVDTFRPAVWVRSLPAAKILDVFLLSSFVLILMNLERTFRSAVGTMRWRIKFLVLGLAIIFGARVYTQGQALIYSGQSLSLAGVDTIALALGCCFIAIAYIRAGFEEIDIYPSQAVMEGSVTVFLVGGYLLIVGVMAQIVTFLGRRDNFQLQAFIVLLGISALAVLILSERLRQGIRSFVSRHFYTSRRDTRKIWTLFTQRLASVLDQPGLCLTSAKQISETFNVLSVTVWLTEQSRLVAVASTALKEVRPVELGSLPDAPGGFAEEIRRTPLPFDLEDPKQDWAVALREACPSQFRGGGNRLGIPLATGERVLGIAVLADRVNGARYSVEDLDLLKCIGDQIAAGLLNLRLSEELAHGRELQAFQTMSAFFVHDLKNAASSLGLMLKNLPIHFDDPEFREDALRGISNTANRINQLINGLGVIRNKMELKPVELDLNLLLADSMKEMNAFPGVEVVRDLKPLPKIVADRDHLHTVFTNLLLNAADAVGGAGRVIVETREREGRAVVCVADDGCGMSETFVKNSLFRPFQTTKKRGIGIGMFQSKMIVEAHRGNILVHSEMGKGTTFEVCLPLGTTE